jgi:hypothetical protein
VTTTEQDVGRMAGEVSFDLVSPHDADWFPLRSMLRNGSSETEIAALLTGTPDPTTLRAWLADGAPKRSGRTYAAFFFELDAWTEYWDLYHPETAGCYHFGDGVTDGHLGALMPTPGRGRRAPVFDAWKAYALASRDPQRVRAAERAFEHLVTSRPEAIDAALALDALVRGIVREQLAPLDGDTYFDALERFALDTLPGCPQRSALIADDDPRKRSSPTHTIAGDVMWFAWALALECAQLVAPTSREAELDRALFMAGVAVGCSMDYTFRGRGRTRRAYHGRDAQAWERIWAMGHALRHDFDAAAAEVRELFYIRTYSD